ncbi:phage portal protein [Roseiconus lacunae]|uniref:phage portal protein n=1 Tax=Roseiconus lacunae TaxID=2605694 RepID=UPI001E4CBF2F|nr:phage portal protein [Roseiconus lacunae]MCD0459948.1 phage portal protein [Roseiconus lacunae]
MLRNLASQAASFFSYDALKPSGRRKAPRRTVVREDHHVRGGKHRAIQENASDLARNLSIAAWMVRRHLDYVASFDFHGRNESEELNQRIEKLVAEDSRPSRTDVAGRFGREKMFRIAEARRVLDGDTALIKLDDGRFQGIQADLIRDPSDKQTSETWVNGVMIGRTGRPLSYGIHRRTSDTSVAFVRRVNAPNLIHYGFFDRYAGDQVRGISPLVSALNPLRDVYENFDYALAKSKVSQLFALAFYRDAEDSAGTVEYEGDESETEAGDTNDKYSVDFGGGPALLDLEPGDRAEFLESRQPSSEFQAFTQLIIQCAIKALDIPYSFYDESHTNFFGSRAAWLHYDRSCNDKRADQIEMRRSYTVWKLATWIRDGRLILPRGWRVSDVAFEWVPKGLPWFDTAKEVRGNVAAVKGALDNPQRICRATGTDLYDNIDQIAKAKEYAAKKGVSLEYVLDQAPQIIVPDATDIE